MSYGFWSLKLCDMVEKIHVCLVDFDVFGRDQWEICAIDRICALGLGDIIKFCYVWLLRKCEKTFWLGF